ncbi:MAG: GxGYxYP family putative glycoside hydrolase [bacterium]|jgi:hypothetical protein|nr:GxGYxYP family putative glycoside hydrolase [bacterium]
MRGCRFPHPIDCIWSLYGIVFIWLGLVVPVGAQVESVTSEVEIPSYEDTLYVFDLETYLNRQPENKVWQYDVINMVSALQGLVNRTSPQLYVLYVREGLSGHRMNVDDFWLGILRGGDTRMSKVHFVYLDTLEEVLQTFRHYFGAVVLWDPAVPATANVALTIAGADGYLPLRHDQSPDSLFTQVVRGPAQLPSGERLTGKFTTVEEIPDTDIPTTRVQKTDAYLWAKAIYLDQGLCSPTYLAYSLDPADWDKKVLGVQYPDLQNCMIVNHDFYVGQKAFFMDLDPWWNEVPTDVQASLFQQGIDNKILIQILQSAYRNTREGDRLLRIGGLVPWWAKYSNHGGIGGQHPPVDTVRESLSILSAHNGITDADGAPFGALANASVFQHVPLKDRYFQNPLPPRQPLQDKNYVMFVIGDFTSSAMMYQTIPILWNDISRGMLPITWAFAPMLADRIPQVINYMYETRTSKDYFAGGATGAGLCFPNRFVAPREHSDLEDGLYFWETYSRDAYRRLDLRTTVGADLAQNKVRPTFIGADLQRAFQAFSPQGVGTVKPFENPLYEGVVPFLEESFAFADRMPPIDHIVEVILKNSKKNQPTFQLYRFQLASPTTLLNVWQRLQREHADFSFEVVDPFTFFYLYRQSVGNNQVEANHLIPTILSTNVPHEFKPGEKVTASLTVRNDGWDTWNAPENEPQRRYRLTYQWLYEGETEPEWGRHAAYLPGPVAPGEVTTADILLEAPAREGLYELFLLFEQENVRISNLKERFRVIVQ